MLHCDISHFVPVIAEYLLKEKWYKNTDRWHEEGLLFSFELHLRDPDTGEDARSVLNIIVTQCKAVYFRCGPRTEEKTPWQFTSSHESCWKGDGFSFCRTIFWEMCKEMGIAVPKDAYHSHYFGLFEDPIRRVSVHWKYLDGESYRYKRELLEVTVL